MAQPANQSIKLYHDLRCEPGLGVESRRSSVRRTRGKVEVIVPGQENISTILSRDTAGHKDYSSYMLGDIGDPSTHGMPVVVGERQQTTLANAQGNIQDAAFAYRIGRQSFLRKTEAGVGSDLHQDARDLTPDA